VPKADVLAQLSSQFFLAPAQRRLFAQGMPVFTYHSIATAPRGARDPFLYVTPERFDEQLTLLAKHGFSSGSLDDIAHSSANADKKFVITFDDGYCNVLDNALEILVHHRARSIQFIVADLIGTRNEWDVVHGDVPEPLMDAAQIRTWLQAGQEIGSHSLTHRNLAKLSTADAREQVFASKKKLEDLFGVPIRHFCYPHGKWTPAVRDLVREAGYATACTTEFGVNTSGTPSFELNRVFVLSRSEMLKKAAHRVARKISGR
jgi:peptidoglycan/xylan/chitin deacetylase (PgdA/CDA1 family)